MKANRKTTPSPRTILIGTAGSIVAIVAIAAIVFDDVWRSSSTTIESSPPSRATSAELTTAAQTKVFFGHQSVGDNILDGVPGLFAAHELPPPVIVEGTTAPSTESGFITHSYIGENEHPERKFADFEKILRSGLAEQVDVAVMKLCFLDIGTRTDTDALFARYRQMISRLERDYPHLEILHTTVPLTTDSSLKNRVKIALGGDDRYGQGENVARQRYNELIRNTYPGRVFDIAGLESTSPAGSRDEHSYDGQKYFTLYPGYASDLGHLNAAGSAVAAASFMSTIADIAPQRTQR